MKVESYKIESWKEKEVGLLISEDEDWILVKHIPVDYVIDGYKLYRKKYIKDRISKNKEAKIKRVLGLKKVTINEPKEFNFGSILDVLEWSEKKYGLFEFQEKDESELFYGKVNHSSSKSLIIDMIKSNGTIEFKYDFEFNIAQIRSITFETDYFESIRLLMNDELKKQPTTKAKKS
jgi:hypothetical protein